MAKINKDFLKIGVEVKRCRDCDRVEVVRCKDCKWYQEGEFFASNKFCFRLKHPKEDRKIGYNYAPDDFCSYGEKRIHTIDCWNTPKERGTDNG